MQTLKTAAVVIVLLAVLYGVYTVLNKPAAQQAASDLVREVAPPDITYGTQLQWNQPPSMSPGASGGGNAVPAPESSWPGVPGVPDPALATEAPAQTPQATIAPPVFDNREPETEARRDFDAVPFNPPLDPANRSVPAAEEANNQSIDLGNGMLVRQNPFLNDRGSPEAAARRGSQLGVQAFQRDWRSAREKLENGQYKEALVTLSKYYNSPDLTEEDHRQLLGVLDSLAGQVIYSTEHLLESAYKIGRDETLFEIAENHAVPWQLLANINGIRDPKILVAGTTIKVVRGPFRAEVDLRGGQGELTLFVGEMYAGRFPVSVGNDPEPQPGEYEVRDKRQDRTYFARDGKTIMSGDPGNPYGRAWLDLGREVSIHGSPENGNTLDSGLGCISLSPIDAEDVYGILSMGSRVVIRR